MSRIVDVMAVRLTGHVDYGVLEVLCRELRMESAGHLDDDYDQLFGERFLRPEDEGDSWLQLYRESDAEWDVEVAAEPPLPKPEELDQLRDQIFTAAKLANLTAKVTYQAEQ